MCKFSVRFVKYRAKIYDIVKSTILTFIVSFKSIVSMNTLNDKKITFTTLFLAKTGK